MLGRSILATAAAGLLASVLAVSSSIAADLGTPSTAAPLPSALGWFVHVGPAGVIFSPSASITAGGAGVAGASIKVPANFAIAADIGYLFTPNWSASLTVANPPTASVSATGALAGVGKLGSTTYLPPIAAVQYHFRQFGAFQPYLGAGVNYTWFLANSDAGLTNFRVRSNLGVAVQAGADYMITDHWGVFADVKHVWLNTTAAGSLGAVPVSAKVTLDPTIINAGISYRF